MGKVPRISDAEWEVMHVVWERSPVVAGDVVRELSRAPAGIIGPFAPCSRASRARARSP